MASLGPFVANTQTDQHIRATTHRPYKPEIPGDHHCPQGACAIKPPPPPVTNQPPPSSNSESFVSEQHQNPPFTYWILLASLTVTLALLRATSK